MKTFHLTIAKIGENLFDDDVKSVILPGKDGVFQVLANHEAFISELVKGELVVKTSGDKIEKFSLLEGGIAEISNNQATVLL